MGAVLNNNWPISYVAAIEYSCFFGSKPLGWGVMGLVPLGREWDKRKVRIFSNSVPVQTLSWHLLESGVYLRLGILAGEARGNRLLERQDSSQNPGCFSLLFPLSLSRFKLHRCPVGVSLGDVISTQGGLRH